MTIAVRLALLVAVAGLSVAGPAAAPQEAQAPNAPAPSAPTAPASRPSFRAGVDVIPVDVQVVDRDGNPVDGLTADAFEVTINGRRRRVVSVDLVDSRPASNTAQPAVPTAPATSSSTQAPSLDAPGVSSATRRIYVLAIDTASFDESTARPVLIAAAEFINRLQPQDEVGLFAYPIGPKIDPTTDHDAVARALRTVISARETAPPGEFYLTPSNIVELSRQPATPLAEQLIRTFCPQTEDSPEQLRCIELLFAQVRGEMLFYEGVAYSGTATLRALMVALGAVAERKTVVLVSGGVVASDIVGGRPDVGALATDLGRVAAQSNVNVYALFVDQLWMRQMSAESRRPPVAPDPARERVLTSRMLEEFSDASGGTLLRVVAGNGSIAFDRLLRETSAHYMLAVESAPEDRAGRPRELRVRVRNRNVSVRGRSWIGLPDVTSAPQRGATPATAAAPAAPPPTPTLPPATAPVRSLAEAFDRDDLGAIVQALAPANASGLLRAFREHDSPWPSSPRRTAAFALDLAMTGVRSTSPYTREEALRVLVEYMVRVRQAVTGDPFECAWLWTASAGTAGLFSPDVAGIVAERGAERCPADGSLHLARAMARDQQLVLAQRQLGRSNERFELERRVLELYEAAAAFPVSTFEARLRAAHVLLRSEQYGDGLALLDSAGTAPDDPALRYYGHLVRGQLLQGLDRLDDAAAAFRAALEAWPDAQSARVSLLALHVRRGQTDEAAAAAGSVLRAPDTAIDPWWVYFLGDYRAYGGIRSQLRQLAP
jgi:VWFA-related protein